MENVPVVSFAENQLPFDINLKRKGSAYERYIVMKISLQLS